MRAVDWSGQEWCMFRERAHPPDCSPKVGNAPLLVSPLIPYSLRALGPGKRSDMRLPAFPSLGNNSNMFCFHDSGVLTTIEFSRLVIAGPVEAKGVIKERKQKVRKVVSTALKDKCPRAIPESRKHRTPYGGRWSSPTLTF